MRYKGLTESDFTPLLHDSVFKDLNKWFTIRNGDKLLVKEDASSRKLKIQTKMISIIKKSLTDLDKLSEFNKNYCKCKRSDRTKKILYVRLWIQQLREVILGTQETLHPGQNYDKFHMENLIAWWKKKASKRYEKLKSDGRLRTTLETWNVNPDEIDIIR